MGSPKFSMLHSEVPENLTNTVAEITDTANTIKLFDFSQALKLLKSGKSVSRNGILVSLDNGWTPSQEDLLAEDFMEV